MLQSVEHAIPISQAVEEQPVLSNRLGPLAMYRGGEMPAAQILEGNAQKFVGSTLNNLIALSEQAAGKKALVVGVEMDVLFPLHQQQTVASLLTESGLDVTFDT